MTITVQPPVVLTRHALRRMQEMGVTREEVVTAVRTPGVTYAGSHHSPPETIAIQGRVAVAFQVRSGEVVVLTVLWTGKIFVRSESSS